MISKVRTRRRDGERLPDVHITARKTEIARHDADNGRVMPIQKDGLSDDLWAGCETALPNPVTQNGDLTVIGLEFVCCEAAAQPRRHSQHL